MYKIFTLAGLGLLLGACSGTEKVLKGDEWMFKSMNRLDAYNPLLEPNRRSDFFCPVRRREVDWEERAVFNPSAVVKDGRVWLLYRAQDQYGTSRIGLANSRNGLDFNKNKLPVLRPENDAYKDLDWEGGCEDPRVVLREDGMHVMTYTAYDKKVARMCIATSHDLYSWEKHGPVLRERKYRDLWSKGGAIVCERDGSKIVAKKIKGKYWMYWGDTDLFMASSDDLIRWETLEDKKGNLRRVMMPRPGMFDSRMVTPGPFALLQKEGILLLYNAANSASSGDKTMGAGVYSVGQALFSAKKPWEMRARANRYLITPEQNFEKAGETPNVCFLQGMAWVNSRWLMYYGAADTRIGVAEGKR